MSKRIYHNHHIIPRHAGGTDDPSNIVRLTVEEHAEAHRILYEEHGRIEDKIAWKCLSGKSSETEADFRELYRQAGLKSLGRTHSQETKDKIGNANRKSKRPDLAEYNRQNKKGKAIHWTEDDIRKRVESTKRFYQTPEGIELRRQQSERMKRNNPAKRSH